MLGRRLYYSIKPYISWRLRLKMRRWLASRALRRSTGIWPILPGSDREPEGWSGWPEGKQFAVVLTHDVEGQTGLSRVKRLAELEKSLGFRSSFNLIPEGEYTASSELRGWLTQEGFEVGVHDLHHDGSLFRSDDDFRRQAPSINRYLKEWGATGFRAGFMFHNLDWIQQLDVDYDASTFDTDPFEPQPEGVGTIYPFWVNGKNGRPGYVELPYTLVQDSTLFLLLQEQTCSVWQRKLDWIAERGGMVLLNLHPDYMSLANEAPSPREFSNLHYVEFLSYINQRYSGKFWNVTARELARWYRSQLLQGNAPSSKLLTKTSAG
jgi:hypothetical protein